MKKGRLVIIKKTSKKGNPYYQLLVECERFKKYIFVNDIEFEYLMSKDMVDDLVDMTIDKK